MTPFPFIRCALTAVFLAVGGYHAGWRARDRELVPVVALPTPAPLPRVHVRPTPGAEKPIIFSL